jgi:chlorite dismutase
MTKEALKLALEALDDLMYWDNGKPEFDEARKAITAIKETLEQQEQGEPASVTYQEVADTMNCLWNGSTEQLQMAQLLENKKLYITQQQRTWVGLTDEEYGAMYTTHLRNGGPIQQFSRATEAKLKEKNT